MSKPSLRIALVKRRCSLRAGGSERYCVNLFRALRDRGHQVTVIGAAIDDDLAGEIPFLRVPIVRWTSSTKNRSFAEGVGRVVATESFDVVYGLGRACGVDMVRVTERLQRHWVEEYYRPGIVRACQRWNPRHRTLIDLERRIYRAETTRFVVTQAPLDRELLITEYGIPPEKIRVIPNGVDLERFHPPEGESANHPRRELGLAPQQPLVLFVAHDFDGKGLRPLMQALAGAARPEMHLAVIGAGPTAKYRRLAARFGLGPRVHFLGRRDDVPAWHQAADLCALPTIYEPCPNVVLEAMASGTPALTTATAGAGGFIEHGRNGYVISAAAAVDEMTAALDAFGGLPPAERQRMGERARGAIAPYTFDRNVSETLQLMEAIAHGRHSDRILGSGPRHDQSAVPRVA